MIVQGDCFIVEISHSYYPPSASPGNDNVSCFALSASRCSITTFFGHLNQSNASSQRQFGGVGGYVHSCPLKQGCVKLENTNIVLELYGWIFAI